MSAYVDLAIKEAADIIVSDMNRRVPVDTGTLASTISVERLGPMKYRIKAGGLKTTKGVTTTQRVLSLAIITRLLSRSFTRLTAPTRGRRKTGSERP
jgi:hypothetical protein